MFRFLSVLAALYSFQAFAMASDRTDAILDEYKQNKFTIIQEIETPKIKIHLCITTAGRDVLQKGNFDIEDKIFSYDAYIQFVASHFKKSVEFFTHTLELANQTSPIQDFYVMLDDLGEERKTTVSFAKTNSRFISSDVRRWHKFYKGYRSFIGDLTAIHEFTHINNYFIDSQENQKHRELTAVVFELLYLNELIDKEELRLVYPSKIAGKVLNPADLFSSGYKNMTVLRNLAFSFVTKTWDGQYKSSKPNAALEFAVYYLNSMKTGDSGFNEALMAADFTDDMGNRLTLNKIAEDLKLELEKH